MDNLYGESLTWTEKLPSNFDLIIGIPRSGLLVAGVIANRFGLPLSVPSCFLRGEEYWASYLYWDRQHKIKRILLVDEAISNGQVIFALRDLLQSQGYIVATASLYVNTIYARDNVDYYYKARLGGPILYGWDLLENPKESIVGKCLCVDFDGVLCHNGNEDPYLIPKFPVYAIISARLEKYREQSEEWLKINKVQYTHLYMRPASEVKSADFKSQKLLEINASMFWESNINEAKQIRKKTKIPILCVDIMQFVK